MFCAVCVSQHRNAIDDALENGEVQRDVAKRYGLNPSSLSRHLSREHPRAESLAEIGDEPVLPSYEWVHRQARARGVRVEDLLVLRPVRDPFYCGSPTDIERAEWFADIWSRYTKGLGEEERKHLRYLHYRCVVSDPRPLWPEKTKYENTDEDWARLQRYSIPARWLGLVDAELFEDKKNEPPRFNAPYCRLVLDPSLELPDWTQWQMPSIDSSLWTPRWNVPLMPDINNGYDADRYLDQPCMVGIFIEKSTMNSWLEPLCRELSVELYVAAGYQSITNAITFCKRAAELRKPAHLLTICDFDPQGDRMTLSASRHVEYRLRQRYPNIEVTANTLALLEDQVKRYKLPRAPIKSSNRMRARFEELHDEGAVELDSVEALHPGTLQAIVRKAVLAYRDDSIQQRLADTRAKAKAALRRKWNAKVAPIEERASATRAEAVDIAATFEKRLAKLNAELQKKLQPHQRQMVALEQEARDAVGELVAGFELPKRPAPMIAPDNSKYLFDSRRPYFKQLGEYHAYSPPPKPERKPRGGRRIPGGGRKP